MSNNIIPNNFLSFNKKKKTDIVKSLLIEKDINNVFSSVLTYESSKLEMINIINDICIDEEVLKKISVRNSLEKDIPVIIFIRSKIINNLLFLNKEEIMKSYFKTLNLSNLHDLLQYEKSNITEVSRNSKVFISLWNATCKDDSVTEVLDIIKEEKKEYKKSKTEVLNIEYIKPHIIKSSIKNKKIILSGFLGLSIVCLSFLIIFINNEILIKKYSGKTLPNVYINNKIISNIPMSDLKHVISNKVNKKIIFTNGTDKLSFYLDDLGIKINVKKSEKAINDYFKSISRWEKISLIKGKKQKNFLLYLEYSDDDLYNIVKNIKEGLDTKKVEASLMEKTNRDIYFNEGKDGFILNVEKTKQELEKKLNSKTEVIEVVAVGKVDKVNKEAHELSKINKKIASFKTHFLNEGPRGSNVTLSAKKINGKVLMPGEIFSFRKEAGPYTSGNGYKSAPIYVGGVASYSAGGGVCQMATTIYNAQLRANLETIYRTNHSIAVPYVEKGLDATVYSTSVDYKFKNQYKTPIYIASYVIDNYLYVDIWSNDKLLNGSIFTPKSSRAKDGGWDAYLYEYKNDAVINKKYLGKSYYRR